MHSSGYFRSALQSSLLTGAKRSSSYEQIEKVLTKEGAPILQKETQPAVSTSPLTPHSSSPPRAKLTSHSSLKDLLAKSEKKYLKLSFPDPDGIFPSVLRFMYEGKKKKKKWKNERFFLFCYSLFRNNDN